MKFPLERVLSVVFFGAFLALLPLTLFYGGIFVRYFGAYEISEYFNGFFTRNLNLYFFAAFALFSGIAFVSSSNILKALYFLCVVAMSLTIIPSVGKNIGERLFLREGVTLNIKGEKKIVRIIYRDKYKIYYNTDAEPKIVRESLVRR